MNIRTSAITLALIAFGGLGGWLAHLTPLPLPYMLGSLLAAGTLAMISPRFLPEGYGFPQNLRTAFIAIIGIMIGARVTPELLGSLHEVIYSLIAVTVFVVLAQLVNTYIFQRIGGMDRTTAFFAGAPGGLIESITLGEAAGAQIQPLVVQQFLRIITVVAILPIIISLWVGHPVGSAGGVLGSMGAPLDLMSTGWLIATAAAGLLIGRALRLPAWQLTGPLLAAALVGVTGYASLSVPVWLVNLSQIVIGTSLGMRFNGLDHRVLLRGIGLSLLSVIAMLLIGGSLSLLIMDVVDQPLQVLLITFAPGGVTEMGLIALSLHANPAFVTLHHIYRITITVIMLGIGSKRFAPVAGTFDSSDAKSVDRE